MKLALYVTGHGYGHLTRSLAIANEVLRQVPETELHVRAPYPAEQIGQTMSRPPASFSPVRLDIGLVARDSLRTDLEASLERLDHYYGPEGTKLVEQEAEWLTTTGIQAALLDIPPRGFDACHLAGVPAFGCSNFSWDDIWRDLGDRDPRFFHYADLASASYASCRLLFRLPMQVGMSAFPRVEPVPFVARHSHFSREEVRQRLRLDPDERPMVLLAYGGEGLQGLTLPPKELFERFHIFATPPLPDLGGGIQYVDDAALEQADLRYNDLIRGMDIVMTKPGYSTVAEATANGCALVLTDRRDFLEGPAINSYAVKHLRAEMIANDDLYAGRWGEVLDRIARKLPVRHDAIPTNGAEVVAKRLLEEMGEL